MMTDDNELYKKFTEEYKFMEILHMRKTVYTRAWEWG